MTTEYGILSDQIQRIDWHLRYHLKQPELLYERHLCCRNKQCTHKIYGMGGHTSMACGSLPNNKH